MNRKAQAPHPFRPDGLDLSTMTAAELEQLKQEIMRRSREAADPRGVGLDAAMMSDVSFMTDDWVYADWWQWVEQIVNSIAVASTRIGAAVIAAGSAIGGGLLFGSGHSGWAQVTLSIGLASVVVVALSALATTMRGARSPGQRR